MRIQHEARVLRTRISQTKYVLDNLRLTVGDELIMFRDACTKSAQSIKLLQNAAYILNSDTRECKDEISELSISVRICIVYLG